MRRSARCGARYGYAVCGRGPWSITTLSKARLSAKKACSDRKGRKGRQAAICAWTCLDYGVKYTVALLMQVDALAMHVVWGCIFDLR